MHKIEGAHLQCVKNHYAKLEYKGMKTVRVTDYTNQTPSKQFGRKCLSSTPLKNEKIFTKCAQNRWCISSICEQSLCKVLNKRNENFRSYRLHKLGTPKVLWTDKQTDGQTEWIHYWTCYP